MSYQVRSAQLSDSQAILQLFSRTPQSGKITLNFERSPCYFHGAHVSCEQPDTYVAEEAETGRLVGVGNIGSRTLFVNGQPRSIRYAHDLRVEPTYRGGPVLLDLYSIIRQVTDDSDWLQAVILADNAPYLKAVSKPKPGLPCFLPHGMIETSLIFNSRHTRSPKSSLEIRPATHADIKDMQRFLDQQGPTKQFFPRYRLSELVNESAYFRGLKPSNYWIALSGSRLVGMVGVWDQKAFKQTRVIGYSKSLNRLRHVYNLHSFIRGGPHLPAAGEQLSYLTLHTMLIEDNNPALFKLLLRTIQAHLGHRYDALVCGLFEEDPLKSVLQDFRRQTLRSQHFLVAYNGDPRLTLDQRTPYVDIARL